MGLSSGRVGHLTSGALPRDPDSVSLEWSRGTYIIKVFPGEEQAELRTAALGEVSHQDLWTFMQPTSHVSCLEVEPPH